MTDRDLKELYLNNLHDFCKNIILFKINGYIDNDLLKIRLIFENFI